MKTNGYTLTELLITIVVIAILGILIGGAFSDEAGANEERAIPAYLNEHGAGFIYSDGYVIILRNGSLEWSTPQEACRVLKGLDSSVKHVTLTTASGTTSETELVWNNDHTELSNLNGRNGADCN